jgi:hypothetical protein
MPSRLNFALKTQGAFFQRPFRNESALQEPTVPKGFRFGVEAPFSSIGF